MKVTQKNSPSVAQTEPTAAKLTQTDPRATGARRDPLDALATSSLQTARNAAGVNLGGDSAASMAAQTAKALAGNVFALGEKPRSYGPSPVGTQALAMAEGRYDQSMLLAEVHRMTGVKLESMPKPGSKFLMVIPEQGYWSSELTLMDQVLRSAGYQVDFMTPTGAKPNVLDVSLQPGFTDWAWGANQVSEGEAALGKQYSDPSTPQGKQLEKPLSLNEFIPVRPAPKEGLTNPNVVKEYEAKLTESFTKASEYSGLVVVGGSGAFVDLGSDSRLSALINFMDAEKRPIAGICYGMLPIAQTKDHIEVGPNGEITDPGRSIVRGKLVTGHSAIDDWKEGTGWKVGPGPSEWGGSKGGSPPVDLEQMLTEYAGDKGGFFSPEGSPLAAAIDGNIISGRTTPDGYPAAMMLMARLHGGGKLPERFVIDDNTLGRVPSQSEVIVQEN
jgi:putative intracellular protease/amidase